MAEPTAKNVIRVDVAVDEEGKATIKLNELQEAAKASGITIDRSYTRGTGVVTELTKATEATAKAQADAGKAAEATGITISRTYAEARKEIEATGKSAQQLANEERAAQQARFDARARSSTPAPADPAARAASERAYANRSQPTFDPNQPPPPDDTDTPGGRRPRLFQMTEAILLRDMIKSVIREIGDLGKEWANSLKESEDATRSLTNSALDLHTSVQRNIQDAKDLAAANRDALSASQAAAIVEASTGLAKSAGRADENRALQQAVTDLAAARGIGADKVSSLVEQVGRGGGDALRKLTGVDDVDALNRYASAHDKLSSALSKTEQQEARLDVVIRAGAIHKGEAERQARDFAEQMTRLSSSVEEIFDKPVTGIYRFVYNTTKEGINGARQAWADWNKEKPSLFETNKELASFDDQSQSVFAKGEQTARRFFETFKADPIREAKEALKDFQIQLEGVTGNPDASAKQGGLKNLADQFDDLRSKVKGVADASVQDEITRLAQRIENETARAAKEIQVKADESAKRLRGLRDDARSLIEDLSVRAHSDNPFVKLLTDAGHTAEQLQKRFKDLGGDVVNLLSQLEGKQFFKQLDTLRLSTQLNAFDLRQEARRLREGPELTGQAAQADLDARLNAFVGAQMSGRIHGDAASLFQFGTSSTSSARSLQERLREIDRIAATARDAQVGAEFRDKSLIETVRRARGEDLTTGIREQAARALDRQADRVLANEQAAIQERKDRADVMSKLNKLISDKGLKIDGPPSSVSLNIGDGLTASTDLLGPRPTWEPEPMPGEAKGFRY